MTKPSPLATHAAALEAVRTLLRYIGDDPDRDGLIETPERVLRAWAMDWGSGYLASPPDLKLFPTADMLGTEDLDQMVLVKDISFISTCEHHLAIFFGVVHVAYFPTKRGVVGISKLVRVVNFYSRRLQTQERLGAQIASYLVGGLSPDVAVSMSALHSCMFSRGVRQPNARTVTTALRGKFREPEAQQEFLRKTEQ
jgi:GTP cyclohydrolase IA